MEGSPCFLERNSVDVAGGRSLGTCAGPMSLLIQTCHRRLQQCIRSGVLKGVLEALALDLKARDAMDVREAFIDGRFAAAKKGRQNWKSKHGKGTKIMAIRDREGFASSRTRRECNSARSEISRSYLGRNADFGSSSEFSWGQRL